MAGDTYNLSGDFPNATINIKSLLGAHLEPPPPPFMADDLPKDFVERPGEFAQLIDHLLDERREQPVAITAALRGAGGYGKTILAKALCHNQQIRQAFKDGILWVTLGETANVQAGLIKLYAGLTGQRPGFVDLEDATNTLATAWGEKECLLVIDDVWDNAHLGPFLRGGPRCARLITTRIRTTLPPGTRQVDVDAMKPKEAAQLLRSGLPAGNQPALHALAARLGEWPLLLSLVNGALRSHVNDSNQTLPDALAYVNEALDRYGLEAFDARDPIERKQAVEKTLHVSLDQLSTNDRARYGELAIFPEDVDIPLATLAKLWDATSGLDIFAAEEICTRLSERSLLERFDLATRTIRLHDVVRAYLMHEHATDLPALHNRLLDAYDTRYLGAWPKGPNDGYFFKHLAYHLVESGRQEELYVLLLGFEWLQAKLAATDINELIADYRFLSGDLNLRLMQDALRLSAHVLAQDKSQLTGQLWGRLLSHHDNPTIQKLLEEAKQYKAPTWLCPLTPTLTQAGDPLYRELSGHKETVYALAVTRDEQWVVSASADSTLKLWDWDRGKELFTLPGHKEAVWAVAATPDGKRVVSSSNDTTLKVWDLEQPINEPLTFTNHENWVHAVAVTADGQLAVSGSESGKLRVWSIDTGEEMLAIQAHANYINAVAVTRAGWVVTASRDLTLKVWDVQSGEALHTLVGHTNSVLAVAVTPDGTRAVSGSRDRDLRVWDLHTGELIYVLKGHTESIRGVAVTPDGKRAISGSGDGTFKVWDIVNGKLLHTEHARSGPLTAVAVIQEGRKVLTASESQTVRVWDLERETVQHAVSSHRDAVFALAMTADGQRVISASQDKKLKVWDVKSGEELRTISSMHLLMDIEKHPKTWIYALAVLKDGRVISASWDKTLKVWDLDSDKEPDTLSGHTSAVKAVAVTKNGRVVSGARDATLKVWNLEHPTHEPLMLTGHRASIDGVAVTPDGRYAVSASADTTVRVWDLMSGHALRTFSGHTASVNAVAITPSNYVISASCDTTLKVWDLTTAERKELLTLSGHTGWVHAVAVTPDGKYAVSASEDHTLKVWDIQNLYDRRVERCIATFTGEGALSACAIAPDGLTVVAGEKLGGVHFLRLEKP
jgi:WD40 repeat protein